MNDANGQDGFERRAAQLLRAEADVVDAGTRARLARARQQAIAASHRPPVLRYLAPAGVMAAALLAIVLFVGRGGAPDPRRNDAGALVAQELDLFTDPDAWELAQEPDLEFIEWAAAIARQEGAGG